MKQDIFYQIRLRWENGWNTYVSLGLFSNESDKFVYLIYFLENGIKIQMELGSCIEAQA